MSTNAEAIANLTARQQSLQRMAGLVPNLTLNSGQVSFEALNPNAPLGQETCVITISAESVARVLQEELEACEDQIAALSNEPEVNP